jgi:hypothetical protein
VDLAPLVAKIAEAEYIQTTNWLRMLICEERLVLERARFRWGQTDLKAHNDMLLKIEADMADASRQWANAKDMAAEFAREMDYLMQVTP